MKKQTQNSFRILFFALIALASFSCKKSDDSPAPANTIKVGTSTQAVSHVYYDNSNRGKNHSLYILSEGVSIVDYDYSGTGKSFYLNFTTEDTSSTLPAGTYTASTKVVANPVEVATAATVAKTASSGDLYVDIYNVSDGKTTYLDGDDNTTGLQNKELVVTKSGNNYTITFKSKSGVNNTAYEVYFNGKVEKAAFLK